MDKRHELKEKAGKMTKRAKTEVKKNYGINEKSDSRPRYVPGSWKGTKENPKMSKIRYKQRYIPGFWKGNAKKDSYRPRYVPGFWKGTKEAPKKSEKFIYKPRYIPGSWKGTPEI
jgi:hypothetical protein